MRYVPTLAFSRCRRGVSGLWLGALILTGCAGRTADPARGSRAYVVHISTTRTADHGPISSVAVPVALGSEGKVKAASRRPVENQPVTTEFLVRLNRTRQPGVYEMVTRVVVKEENRNKKGKLKVSKRFLGSLVPTRLGETQIVSADSDPIHVEARLERR